MERGEKTAAHGAGELHRVDDGLFPVLQTGESEYLMAKGQKPDYSVSVSHQNGGKTHYTTVGAAWNVAKGGISVKLQALPADGSLVLFPYREKADN